MSYRAARPTSRAGLVFLTLIAADPASSPFSLRTAFAQTVPSRLETLDLGVGVYSDANHGLFHDFWDPGTGLEAFLAFPFYIGRLRLGVQQFHNDAITEAVGFRSRYFHVGFDLGVPFTGGARLRAGPEVGIYHMWFDDESLPDFSRSESEFAIGGATGLDLFPGRRLGFALVGRYQVVLTERRIHRVMVGATVSYRAGFPTWLRGFLD
jgi:hypothetical protein